jgi:hypothetical protein
VKPSTWGIIGAILALLLNNTIVTLIVLAAVLTPFAVRLIIVAGMADDPKVREKYNRER